MAPNRSLKQTVGRIVLVAYLAGYLGLLLIGEPAVLVAIPGFVLTVVAGLVNAPRRQRWAGVPGAPGAWAPFKIGAPLFAIVPGLLAAFYLVDVLSGGRGISDIGGTGLLLPRAHYTLSNDGVDAEVERWRFIVVGLLFYSLWFAGGAVAAWLVFFKPAPSIPAGPPGGATPRRSPHHPGGHRRVIWRALVGFVFAVAFIFQFVVIATLVVGNDTFGQSHMRVLVANLCVMAVSGIVHWAMGRGDEA